MKFRFQNLRNLFKDNRLNAAFAAVKFDMDNLEDNHNALKMSTNDWIVFLDDENQHLKMRVRELERKMESMENKRLARNEDELSVLRTL